MSPTIKVFGSPNRANIGIVQGSEYSLLVDTGHNRDHLDQLFHLVPSLNNKVDFAILTHYHMDHTLGFGYLDCPGISQKNMVQNLLNSRKLDYSDEGIQKNIKDGVLDKGLDRWYQREYPNRDDIRIRLPSITYNQSLTLDLGNVIAELSHIDCDHTNDTTVVYVPEEEALFVGDCLSPGPLPKHTFSMTVLRNMLDYFFSFDSKVFVEGHGPPLGNGEGNNYLMDLLKVVDFFEIYKEESLSLVDTIFTKMEIFDKDSVETYLSLFKNGL